jgi:hypothetical protein
MKQTAFLFAAILLLAAGAFAQAGPDDAQTVTPAGSTADLPIAPSASPLFAMAATPAPLAADGLGATPSSSADTRPTVYNVYESYNWQATAGYTFYRFYLVPRTTLNLNGLNLGLVYYPKGLWVGVDGNFDGAWGSYLGRTAKYVQAMGGPRFRWSAPRGIEIWGHGLVGGAHFLPQTNYGDQAAFAYMVGGGVDLNLHQRRIAYRVSADMVGTRFFSTYQYSPKISAGIVFKF